MTSDAGALLDMFGGDDRRPLAAHIWRRVPDGFYLEPEWCSEQLLAVESFVGTVWDCCCGTGRIPQAPRRAGYTTVATDIANRGYHHLDGIDDFLQCDRRVETSSQLRSPRAEAHH